MGKTTISRRTVLAAGACALPAVTSAQAVGANGAPGLNPRAEETVRAWYRAWEQKDWKPVDALLAGHFTFSSAAGDDHISKAEFKAQCWETQKNFIDRFDLLHVFGSGNEALVLYVGRTKNGNTFRNVEYVRVKEGQLESIECYFGQESSFPSAASKSVTS